LHVHTAAITVNVKTFWYYIRQHVNPTTLTYSSLLHQTYHCSWWNHHILVQQRYKTFLVYSEIQSNYSYLYKQHQLPRAVFSFPRSNYCGFA